MGDGHNEDPRAFEEDDLATDPGPSWGGVGASRAPRPPAEGVRIIGAEEAAAAIESGEVAPRQPEDAPRFGDVPPAPSGPRPPFRFPGDDPATVPKPAVVAPEPDPSMPGFTMGHMGGGFNEELVSGPASAGQTEGATAATPAPAAHAGGGDDSNDSGVGLFESAEQSAGPSRASSFDSFFLGRSARSGEDAETPGAERRSAFSTKFWERSGDDGGLAPSSSSSRDLFDSAPAGSSGRGDPLARVGGRQWWDEAEATPGRRTESAGEHGREFFDNPPPSFSGSGRNFWDEPSFEEPTSGAGSGTAPSMPEPGDIDVDPFNGGEGGDEREDSGSTPLPHWTEPPSGEVPRILPDADPVTGTGTEEVNAWTSLSTGPRWRDHPTDWDEADFHEAIVEDEETRVGALRTSPPLPTDEDMFNFEEAPDGRAARAPRTDRRPRSRPQPPSPDSPGAGYAGADTLGGAAPSSGDVGTRVITGLIVAGVALTAAVIGPAALLTVVTAAVVMAAAELFQALRTRGYQPATLLGLVATAALMGGVYWRGETAFPLVLALYTVFCLLWYLLGVVRARPTMNVAVSIMAFLYVGFLGSFAALILKVFGDNGIGVLLGAIIATVAYDVGAFFVGRSFGKTPLAPSISPGKTFEGMVGASLFTVVVSLAVVSQIFPWNAGRAFWLAVVVVVVAPLGDLCESMIKRDLDVKDMGNVLPGHGGVLDRIDALLFVVPATYYLLWLLLN